MKTADGRARAAAILDAGKSTGGDVPGPTEADDADGVDMALEEAWTAAFERKDKAGFKSAIRAAMTMQHHAQTGDSETQESAGERDYER